MRITLRVVGGFTGRAGAEVYEVDVDRLPHDEASRLQRLVAAAGFFSLAPDVRKPAPASWDFLHELTIADGNKIHTVRFHLDAVPTALRTLCDEIIAQAQRGRPD